MRKAHLVLVVPALAAAMGLSGPVLAGGDETPSARAVVERRLAREIGRPVDARITLETVRTPWTLMCGAPLEPGGADFNIARSPLADNEFGANFCALVETTNGAPQVIEFEIGGNDMPAVDWLETRDLPMEMLADQ